MLEVTGARVAELAATFRRIWSIGPASAISAARAPLADAAAVWSGADFHLQLRVQDPVPALRAAAAAHSELEDSVPVRQHLALDVDDFEAVYRTAKARGVLEHETLYNCMYELRTAPFRCACATLPVT